MHSHGIYKSQVIFHHDINIHTFVDILNICVHHHIIDIYFIIRVPFFFGNTSQCVLSSKQEREWKICFSNFHFENVL